MRRAPGDLLVLGRIYGITQKGVVRALLLDITPTYGSRRWEMFAQVKECGGGDKCSAEIPAPTCHTIFACVSIVDELSDDIFVIVGG